MRGGVKYHTSTRMEIPAWDILSYQVSAITIRCVIPTVQCLVNISRVFAGIARFCSRDFFGKMNSSLFVHPWSPECFSTDKFDENDCTNSSKDYMDISTEDYQVRNTVLCVLLTIMLFGGILTILSNSIVLFFGLTRYVNI